MTPTPARKPTKRAPSQAIALARIEEALVSIRRDLDGDRESRRVMHEKIDHLSEQNARQDQTIALAGETTSQLRDIILRVDTDLSNKITTLTDDISKNVKPTVAQFNLLLKTGRGVAILLSVAGLSVGVLAMAAWEGARHTVGDWLLWLFNH